MDTLYQRGYVAKLERALRSTDLGRAVCDFLLLHFPSVFAVSFTARMEDQLDNIAQGEAEWTAVMAEMWGPLSALVAQAQAAVAGQPKIRVAGAAADPRQAWSGKGRRSGGRKGAGRKSWSRKATATLGSAPDEAAAATGTAPKRAARKSGGKSTASRKGGRASQAAATPEGGAAVAAANAAATGQACPQCGRPLVQRTSKFGPFIGCSGFPKCRYIARPDKGAPADPAGD